MAYMNFSWIIEGTLAGAAGPTTNRDITFLKLQEIQAVIRMEEQTISTDPWGFEELYEPVQDFRAPDMEQIERMVKFIEDEIETWEHPVVVTCQAGMGRTGTVLASYLVYVGYKAEPAIKLVRELRPGSIQSGAQEESIHRFFDYLKEREQERRMKAREALGDN